MTERASSAEDGVAYAKEVYAACATVGFSDDAVGRLKRLLDDLDAGRRFDDAAAAELVAAAQKAQLASIAWAGR